MLNRRKFLLDGSLAIVGACKCGVEVNPIGLRDVARCSPWLIGGAVSLGDIASDTPLASRLVRECSIVTPAVELKWQTVHPALNEFRFDHADKFMGWAQNNSLQVRGHNLVWPNYGTPKWVSESATKSNAQALLEEHIHTVAGRYAGRIHTWDVLNEGLNIWDKRSDLLAIHPWVELIGPEYIDIAFHAAARADPHARLLWNQNYIEADNAGDAQNRDALLVQLRRLKKAGVPIHGIGIESHLFAEKPLATAGLEYFVSEVRSLGLEIQITELDVIDTQLPSDNSQRDALVADTYKRYLELIMRIADPTVITFWSLSDRRNWLDWAATSTPKYMRADGAAHRPGLLNSDLREKAAYDAVRTALRQSRPQPGT